MPKSNNVFCISAVDFPFGAIYLSLFLYLLRQQSSVTPKIPSANFWMAIHLPSDVHRLVTGTAFSCHQWNGDYPLSCREQQQTKIFGTLFRMYHIRLNTAVCPENVPWDYESHKDDAATVSSFTEKSQREIKRMEDVIYLTETGTAGRRNYQMEKTEIFPFSYRMFWNALKLMGGTGA